MHKLRWQLGGFLLLLFLPFLLIEFTWTNFAFVLFCLGWFLMIGWLMYRWISNPLKELERFIEDLRLDTPLRSRLLTRRSDIYAELAMGIERIDREHTSQSSTLRGRMEEIQAILTSMSEGVVATDITGQISLINPAAAELFNLASGKGVGEFPYKIFPDSELGDIFHQIYVKGYSLTQEIIWPGDSERVFNLHLAPIRGDLDEEIRGVVAVIGDVTKLRRLETMRKDFVANVSHELRTPMTSITGFIETLLDGALEDKEIAKKFLTIIHQESERLNYLISDLLDISRLESGQTELKKTMIDLEKLIEGIILVVENRLKDKKLELSKEIMAKSFIGDEGLLREVAINLLDNAIKYTPEGGKLVIGSRYVSEGVEFFVKDTGIGIPEESLPRLFERFYRVDKGRSRQMGGTGLGLSIVKHIVERHSGKVSVRSVLGEGSEFSFVIPESIKEKIDGTPE